MICVSIHQSWIVLLLLQAFWSFLLFLEDFVVGLWIMPSSSKHKQSFFLYIIFLSLSQTLSLCLFVRLKTQTLPRNCQWPFLQSKTTHTQSVYREPTWPRQRRPSPPLGHRQAEHSSSPHIANHDCLLSLQCRLLLFSLLSASHSSSPCPLPLSYPFHAFCLHPQILVCFSHTSMR